MPIKRREKRNECSFAQYFFLYCKLCLGLMLGLVFGLRLGLGLGLALDSDFLILTLRNSSLCLLNMQTTLSCCSVS